MYEAPRKAGVVRGRRIPDWIRYAVWARDGWVCAYCGRECRKFRPGNGLPGHDDPACATCDHLVPHGEGGRDVKENLVTCCLSCNDRKHTHSVEVFVAKLVAEGADEGAIRSRLARAASPKEG